MNSNKNWHKLVIVSCCIVLLLSATTTLAATTFPNPVNPQLDSFPKLINQIIKSVLSVAAVIMLVTIVWAGWIWLSARGETAKIASAKKMIYWSVAGMVAILGSYGIIAQILKFIGASS